jgi:hypothetical protein
MGAEEPGSGKVSDGRDFDPSSRPIFERSRVEALRGSERTAE